MIVIILGTATLFHIGFSSDELNIYNTLFANYNKNVRPANTQQATNLTVDMRFFNLLYMEEDQELISFSTDFEMVWIDPFLSWDKNLYNGLDVIHVPETDVWRPDFTVYNSVLQTEVIDADSRLVTISSDGSVLLSNPSVYTSICVLDISYFPFDSQHCEIKLSSWVYTSDDLRVAPASMMFNVSQDFTGNSEWFITNASVVEYNDTSGGVVYAFMELHYTVSMKRHYSYYLYVLLMPTFIVSTLCLIGLFTPFDNIGTRVERVTLGLTTLLSLAVILSIVGDGMPKSTKLPLLGGYVLAEIIICTIGVLVTIILMFFHQRCLTRRIIPPKKFKHHFQGKEAGRMGLRILASKHGNRQESLYGEAEDTLKCVVTYIDNWKAREDLRLYWVRFFDSIDMFCLIFFQIVNFILTICFIFIR